MNKYLTTFLAIGLTSAAAWADVILPKIISDNMILQQGVEAPIWGWADQGEEVIVSFAGQTKQARPDKNGKWIVKLAPLKASAVNRTLTIKGKNEITIQDVLVGEVWLASGQSNMEWVLSLIDKDERAYAATHKDNALVRAFHVSPRLVSSMPLDDTNGSWKGCAKMLSEPMISAKNGFGISSVGLFFALKLQQQLGVPVAILDSNWGGQKIELFIADEGYEALKIQFKKANTLDRTAFIKQVLEKGQKLSAEARKELESGRITSQVRDAKLLGRAQNGIYNAMIYPLTPYAISGAIWYQGESNRGSTDYFKKLQALSQGWSEVFQVENLPIHLVQIAPYDYEKRRSPGPGALSSTLADNIWAAQYHADQKIPNMTLVAIHDTNININDIHPRNKLPVGNRLAERALKLQYGKDFVAGGPRFSSAKKLADKIVVSFANIDQGLSSQDGKAPTWFELSADGENFVNAEAIIKGDTVELTAKVPKPQFVRMGWYDTAIPNLQDKNGWPVRSFPAQPIR